MWIAAINLFQVDVDKQWNCLWYCYESEGTSALVASPFRKSGGNALSLSASLVAAGLSELVYHYQVIAWHVRRELRTVECVCYVSAITLVWIDAWIATWARHRQMRQARASEAGWDVTPGFWNWYFSINVFVEKCFFLLVSDLVKWKLTTVGPFGKIHYWHPLEKILPTPTVSNRLPVKINGSVFV